MTTMTATEARKNLFGLLKAAKQRHEVYHIRYKDGNAVLMSEEEFDNLRETLHLLSTPGFKDSFDAAVREAEAGATVPFEEVFGEEQ